MTTTLKRIRPVFGYDDIFEVEETPFVLETQLDTPFTPEELVEYASYYGPTFPDADDGFADFALDPPPPAPDPIWNVAFGLVDVAGSVSLRAVSETAAKERVRGALGLAQHQIKGVHRG